MKVGDLVRLTRYGWEKTVGVIVERVAPHSGNQAQARVLWATKGTIGICYVEDLEVLDESR
tara:strand:- start:593 stop:775 length:183 start_codon:yes stop_codon:yes gene_type:complete